MIKVHRWIRSHENMTDLELSALLRNRALQEPYVERCYWFEQLELALEGYAGPLEARAARVHIVVEDLLMALTQEGLVRPRV